MKRHTLKFWEAYVIGVEGQHFTEEVRARTEIEARKKIADRLCESHHIVEIGVVA